MESFAAFVKRKGTGLSANALIRAYRAKGGKIQKQSGLATIRKTRGVEQNIAQTKRGAQGGTGIRLRPKKAGGFQLRRYNYTVSYIGQNNRRSYITIASDEKMSRADVLLEAWRAIQGDVEYYKFSEGPYPNEKGELVYNAYEYFMKTARVLHATVSE